MTGAASQPRTLLHNQSCRRKARRKSRRASQIGHKILSLLSRSPSEQLGLSKNILVKYVDQPNKLDRIKTSIQYWVVFHNFGEKKDLSLAFWSIGSKVAGFWFGSCRSALINFHPTESHSLIDYINVLLISWRMMGFLSKRENIDIKVKFLKNPMTISHVPSLPWRWAHFLSSNAPYLGIDTSLLMSVQNAATRGISYDESLVFQRHHCRRCCLGRQNEFLHQHTCQRPIINWKEFGLQSISWCELDVRWGVFSDWLLWWNSRTDYQAFSWPCLTSPLVSEAMASSSIVRDAFHLYIRLAHQLLQSIPDNPNENDLTFQRSRRNEQRCNKSRRRWTVPQRRALRSWWSVMMNTTPTSSLSSISFNTKRAQWWLKTRKRKKMKNPNHEKKESRTGAWKNREEMLKRESWKEKINKWFKMRNPSKAGLGKEQDENDSFEIAARTERKEQRRLSFYWTRTYCKTIFQIADKCICLLIACISFLLNKSQMWLLLF